jgi:hypothetical protein
MHSEIGLIEIILPSSVDILGEKCFSEHKSLSSVRFESGSRLSQIEKEAFSETGLVEIILPGSVKILGERCFEKCKTLSSVRFETRSKWS